MALVGTVGGVVATLSPLAFGLPVGVFEFTIGVWLLARGVRIPEASSERARSASELHAVDHVG